METSTNEEVDTRLKRKIIKGYGEIKIIGKVC